MSKKETILFIINPISGKNSKTDIPGSINRILCDSDLQPEIVFTRKGGDATDFAHAALKEGITKIVAVGGDGTVNEIAKVLRNTAAVLGIIPSGSGNGLARHLKIPIEVDRSLYIIKRKNTLIMDSAELNGHPFFCTAGIGFDAQIGHRFSMAGKRGLQTYLRTTVNEFFSYKPQKYLLSLHEGQVCKDAFLITFANTNQYGNNAFISPEADVTDGLLDICILRPFPKYIAIDMGRRLFGRTMHLSKYMEILRVPYILIEREMMGAAHVDGEPIILGKKIDVKVLPKSLRVFVNK